MAEAVRGKAARRPKRALFRRIVRTLLALFLLGALSAGAFGYVLLTRPFKGFAGEETLVFLPPGSSTAAIFSALEEGGVLRDRRLGLLAWKLVHRGRTLKAGEYRFRGPSAPWQVVAPIVAGAVVTHRVTVPEGLTAEETVGLFSSRGFGSARELQALLARPGEFAGIPKEAPSLEGFLFPETYTVTRTATARDLVALLTREFRRRLPADYERRAAASGFSLVQAVTLASLVEKETAVAAERALVSAVYRNRLARGMLLQCDPTTIYALKRLGRWKGTLSRADLAVDEPYNTYVRPGLPPGPICSPSAASLEAALAPAAVDYLYFVAAGDGSHRFAASYAAHEKNVAAWRRVRRDERRERETPR